MILTKKKEVAKKVDNAVVTVPAYSTMRNSSRLRKAEVYTECRVLSLAFYAASLRIESRSRACAGEQDDGAMCMRLCFGTK